MCVALFMLLKKKETIIHYVWLTWEKRLLAGPVLVKEGKKKEIERGQKSVIKQEMEIMTENILDPKYQVNAVKQTCRDRVGDNRVHCDTVCLGSRPFP